jgi:antitoxin component YwqK of YwqJK toxin-antitoxin module
MWAYWRENGQKATEGQFKDGKRIGEWTHWDENGNMKKIIR